MHKVYDHKELAARIKTMICDNHLFRDIHFSRYTLAKELDISPARVTAIFHEEMGTSFYDFVTRQRIYHARRLLKSAVHKQPHDYAQNVPQGLRNNSGRGKEKRKSLTKHHRFWLGFSYVVTSLFLRNKSHSMPIYTNGLTTDL